MGTEAPQLTNVSFSEPTRRDLLFILLQRVQRAP